MQATIDYPGVQSFATNLEKQRSTMAVGRGAIYTPKPEEFDGYADLCATMMSYLNQWAREIFVGVAEFDPKVEEVIKTELEKVLRGAKVAARLGRNMEEQPDGLKRIHSFIADCGNILDNWISPRKSVNPAPRLRLSEAAIQEIKKNLLKAPPAAP